MNETILYYYGLKPKLTVCYLPPDLKVGVIHDVQIYPVRSINQKSTIVNSIVNQKSKIVNCNDFVNH